MINTYNMRELKAILGINDTTQIKLLMEDGSLPFLTLSPRVYSFPKIGLEDWLIKTGLFRSPEDASAHIQQAVKTLKTKDTKRKQKQKKEEAE